MSVKDEDPIGVAGAEPTPEQQAAEDRAADRCVASFQAGDMEAFGDLYKLYFGRVFGYLRVLLKNTSDAEDGAQQVFAQALEALPRYERRGRPFRAWLFTIVRHYAMQELGRQGKVELVDPAELNRRLDLAGGEEMEEPLSLGWITDKDLLIFVERLPAVQRQVLVLRFMLDLGTAEIARIVGRKPDAVRKMQARSIIFLRERLVAIGRDYADPREQAGSLTYVKQARVIRARRFQLTYNGPNG